MQSLSTCLRERLVAHRARQIHLLHPVLARNVCLDDPTIPSLESDTYMNLTQGEKMYAAGIASHKSMKLATAFLADVLLDANRKIDMASGGAIYLKERRFLAVNDIL